MYHFFIIHEFSKQNSLKVESIDPEKIIDVFWPNTLLGAARLLTIPRCACSLSKRGSGKRDQESIFHSTTVPTAFPSQISFTPT